ncbi:hypothetical protein JOM56_013072 [Amanita muscaria]
MTSYHVGKPVIEDIEKAHCVHHIAEALYTIKPLVDPPISHTVDPLPRSHSAFNLFLNVLSKLFLPFELSTNCLYCARHWQRMPVAGVRDARKLFLNMLSKLFLPFELPTDRRPLLYAPLATAADGWSLRRKKAVSNAGVKPNEKVFAIAIPAIWLFLPTDCLPLLRASLATAADGWSSRCKKAVSDAGVKPNEKVFAIAIPAIWLFLPTDRLPLLCAPLVTDAGGWNLRCRKALSDTGVKPNEIKKFSKHWYSTNVFTLLRSTGAISARFVSTALAVHIAAQMFDPEYRAL